MNIQSPLDQEGSSRPQLRSWQALVAHKTTISKLKLHNLFKENSRRFEDYSIAIDGLLFDYSKNLLTNRTIELLKKLASDCVNPLAILSCEAWFSMISTLSMPFCSVQIYVDGCK